MSAIETLAVIEKVAAAPGKAKQEVLRQNDTPALRLVLKLALDPFITYGVQQFEVPTPVMYSDWDVSFDEGTILKELAERRLTGNAALVYIEEMMLMSHPDAQELFCRIVRKDLRAGIGASTVNKVFPGLIPEFPCMLAKSYEERRVTTWPVAVEPKYDGVRALFVKGRFYTRNGHPIPSVDWLASQIGEQGFVLDGELVSGNFNSTVSHIRNQSNPATDAEFMVFHILSFDEWNGDFSTQQYKDMREELTYQVGRIGIPNVKLTRQVPCFSHEEVLGVYQTILNRGGEGVIVKPYDHKYEGKRSWSWMKIKDVQSVDAPIIGAFEGKGKYEGMLGGLVLDVEGVSVEVGSGFSDQQRKDLWPLPMELIGIPTEVLFHEKTPDGSLRHPRFIKFRFDLAA